MKTSQLLIGWAIRLYRRTPLYPAWGPRLARAMARVRRIVPSRPFVHDFGGFKLWIDLNNVIDANMYYAGSFEPDTVSILEKRIRPGYVVLDIGANIGAHTFAMARLTGSTGRVIAFEPTPWAFGRLKDNAALNSFGNITIENLGLSDRCHQSRGPAFETRYRLDGVPEAGTQDTVFTTLDNYCHEHGIERVNFIKMDVDGFESRILRGGQELLARCRPAMVFELGPDYIAKAGDRVEDLLGMLHGLGYRFYNEKTLNPFDDILKTAATISHGSTMNVYCEVPAT